MAIRGRRGLQWQDDVREGMAVVRLRSCHLVVSHALKEAEEGGGRANGRMRSGDVLRIRVRVGEKEAAPVEAADAGDVIEARAEARGVQAWPRGGDWRRGRGGWRGPGEMGIEDDCGK